MLRTSAIEAAKLVLASNFSLKDLRFEGFEDIGSQALSHSVQVRKNGDISEFEDTFNQLDIWAHFSMEYSGEPPDSYRVLNSILLDWVDDNENEIKKEVNASLIEFLKQTFPNIDISDLQEDFDDYIWEDQVDYMPGIDVEEGRIHFFIELVLEIDDPDEEEGEE